jgi:hypothetical protein
LGHHPLVPQGINKRRTEAEQSPETDNQEYDDDATGQNTTSPCLPIFLQFRDIAACPLNYFCTRNVIQHQRTVRYARSIVNNYKEGLL